jgi:hypothetical protein
MNERPDSSWGNDEGTRIRANFLCKGYEAGLTRPAPQVKESYLAKGFGLTWNFTSLLVVPLPPSIWNGALVA